MAFPSTFFRKLDYWHPSTDRRRKNLACDLRRVTQKDNGVDGFIRVRRMQKNTCAKTRQLDDSLGGTLVLVRELLGNVRRPFR
jgi:hypothetical protein